MGHTYQQVTISGSLANSSCCQWGGPRTGPRKRKSRLKGNVPGPANPPTHTGSVPLPQKPSQREKAPQRQMRDGWGKRVRRLSTHHEMDADRPCCRQPACYQRCKPSGPRDGPHALSYWLKPRPGPLRVQLESLAAARG
jgi:hypothetical protein